MKNKTPRFNWHESSILNNLWIILCVSSKLCPILVRWYIHFGKMFYIGTRKYPLRGYCLAPPEVVKWSGAIFVMKFWSRDGTGRRQTTLEGQTSRLKYLCRLEIGKYVLTRRGIMIGLLNSHLWSNVSEL